MGDIIEIANQNNQVVADYQYDSWGVHTVTNHTLDNIGDINPFRYRGYYYDSETELYYLNTRYYDHRIGRFLNADGIIGANQDFVSNNLCAYVSNNPVMYIDPSGRLKNFFNKIREFFIEVMKPFKLKEQLEEIGFKNVTYKNSFQLYSVMKVNNINSATEKAHFLAQCAYETNFGMWLTELGSEAYFANKPYGYKYRGAGYIQLTWDYNYKSFSEAVGDSYIYSQGADYVAANYAWEAAGWWWSNNNMNSRIANGASVGDVTRRVSGSIQTAGTRQEYYNRIYGILR